MRQKYKGDDIKSRLDNTVIRYKNHPYFCSVEGTILGLHGLAGEGLIVRVDPDDPFIDISSLTLGYVNLDGDLKCAVYLKREANRQYKQGVDLGRLTQFVLKGSGQAVNALYFRCKGLVDCVLDKYPTLDQATMMISKKGYTSVALSRNVAVKREDDLLKVYVKTDEVGYIKMGTTRLVVPKVESSFVNNYFLREITGWDLVEGNR